MSPERMGGLAYWASGGTVAGRRGPITLPRAAALLDFLNAAAETSLTAGDHGAARFCAELALEVGCAIAKAVSWRRCGGG